MAVTYGFYNSSNGDRKYNALQFSRLFEGIIRDGVFSTVGGSLMVVAASNLTVNISPGRAWFNNTWTNNDALLPLTLDPAEAILNRYDAVVLEVAPNERENRFKIVKGTPATTPAKPTMIKSGGIYQYPLAYIYVGKGVGSISQANISNAVGTTECPFITGALQQVTTNDIIAQWESEFNTWFDDLQAQLEGNVVTNLQNQINTKLTADGGDGKDVVVSFTEAATEAHISSGEKLSVLFGKILKNIKSRPISHASTTNKYGVGTTANYGHVKTVENLTTVATDGLALGAGQGKALNEKINNKLKYTVVTLTASGNWTVPNGVTSIDVFTVDGGSGGQGGNTGRGYQQRYYRGKGGKGGASGAIKYTTMRVQQGQVIPYVIGAGGEGGAGAISSGPSSGGSPGSGEQGGASVFGELDAPIYHASISGPTTPSPGSTETTKKTGEAGVSANTKLTRIFGAIETIASGGSGANGSSTTTAAAGGSSPGGGRGGAGGKHKQSGSPGADATVYGCGGGGGGGAGANDPPGNSTNVWTNNPNGYGGRGCQGVIYIGYYGF